MNQQNQQSTSPNFLQNLIGADGLKTDVRVRVQVPDDFYIKLGTTILLVGTLFFVAYYSIKAISDE